MTVAALPSVASYFENGVTTAFAAPFRFKSSGDLIVERIVAGIPITLTIGIDYSVTGGTTDAGGTVTMVAPGMAGSMLRIRRVTARAQPMVYTTGDRFPARSHEDALDRQMLIAQEQDATAAETSLRAVQVPIGEAASVLPSAAARAGKALIGLPGGGFGAASLGVGNDPGLRDDLASAGGAMLLGLGATGIDRQIRRSILRYAGGVADGVTSNRAAILAMLADGGGYLPRQAQPYIVDAPIVMPAGSYLKFEAGTKIRYTGPSTTGGIYSWIFVTQDGCSFGTETGLGADVVEIYTTTPDRYRYAVGGTAVDNVMTCGVVVRNMQRHFWTSSSGSYAGVITTGPNANVCTNIQMFGGGSSYDVPLVGAISNAADYIAYTIGWRIEGADHLGNTSGIEWWGGDADPTKDGARANERKCRDGLIVRCSATNMSGAGIWGSMGQTIRAEFCRVAHIVDVGFDAEGSIGITWFICYGFDCGNGVFSEFFHTEGISAISCTGVGLNGQVVYLFQNGTGYSNGTKLTDCDFSNSGTGVAAISSQFGAVRNLEIARCRGADVVIDMIYNQNQNLSFNIALRVTKVIGVTVFRAGRVYKLGTARGAIIINGTSILTDVPQSGSAMQIDLFDAATPGPIAEVKNTTISEGFANALVTAGTSGQFSIIGGNTLGAASVLKIGTGQTHTINGTYTFAGVAVT